MRIAIVTPYTLLNLGLKHLLQKYFDTTPILYNEISEFFDNAPEQFDAYILFADTIIGGEEYDFAFAREEKIAVSDDCIGKKNIGIELFGRVIEKLGNLVV